MSGVWMRRWAGPPVVAGGLLAAGLFAAPAASAATGGISVPMGFLGLPSVKSIIEGIVNFFFGALARALVPSFLKHASVATIKWLVAVPNPTQWTHVGALAGDMRALSVSVLAVCFTAAIVRHLLGAGGSGNPLRALADTLLAAGWLVAYPWAAGQAVAAVNTLTNAILSFPVVADGLQRTVGVLFGGALLVGAGGVFLAVLVMVAVVFAMVMFAVKVLLLVAVGALYVTGTLAIATKPLPELLQLSRAWGSLAGGIVMVPFGWTILFAVAGALSLDATSFGAGGGMGGHVAAALAALVTFYLAVKLPFAALGRLRSSLVHGTVGGGLSGSNSGRSATGQGVARVSQANARLRNATIATGRQAGKLAGRLGAPQGGPVGAAHRTAGRLAGRLAPIAGAAVLARGLHTAPRSRRPDKTGTGEPKGVRSRMRTGRRRSAGKRGTPSPEQVAARKRAPRRKRAAARSAGRSRAASPARDRSASSSSKGKDGRRSAFRHGARHDSSSSSSSSGHSKSSSNVRGPETPRRKATSPGTPSKRPTPGGAPASSRRPVEPAPDKAAGNAGGQAPSKPPPRAVEPHPPKTPKPDRGRRSAPPRPRRQER